ncbi:MAG: AarF/UbiB family protein [Candidatus Muiribacteriota bacterium]
MKLKNISRNIKNIARMREIITVLSKHGFGFITSKIGKEIGLKVPSLKKNSKQTTPYEERIRQAFEELGPTFIKLGQILSTRTDLLPMPLCLELQKLQDKAPEFPYEEMEEIVEKELGKSVLDVFEYIETTPLGSASLAQVHAAKFKTGQDVILKVQRPGIEKTVKSDVELIFWFAQMLEYYWEDSKFYNPVEVVLKFKKEILKELDFRREKANIEKFAKLMKNEKNLKVPVVYDELTTSKLLVMEKIKGYKITQINEISGDIDRKLTAKNVTRLMLKQIFQTGFFHADPHPGNIFVCQNGKISFIDFGLMGNLRESSKENLSLLLFAISGKDINEIIYVLKKMGSIEDEFDSRKLENDIFEIVEEYYTLKLEEIKISEVLVKILKIISNHQIRIPGDLYTLIIALITFEGVLSLLDPDFMLSEQLEPFIKKMFIERISTDKIINKSKNLTRDLYRLFFSFPSDVQEILNKLKKGKAKIELEHKGIEKFIYEMDRVSNRISFSIVIAAIIIGSSIIINIERGPQIYGYPLLGVAGFIIAGILGFWLAINILRSGKF